MEHKELVLRMKKEVEQIMDEVLLEIEYMRKSFARLDQIALRPSHSSITECIDALIESEKSDAKPCFFERIQQLQNARKQAEIHGVKQPPHNFIKKLFWKLQK